MQTRWLYLRLRLQTFLPPPQFTCLLVLALGLGLAANLVILDFLQATALRSCLTAEPVRLALVWNEVSNTLEEFNARPVAPRPRAASPEPLLTDHQQANYPAQPMQDRLSEVLHSTGIVLSFFVGITLLVAMVTVLVR